MGNSLAVYWLELGTFTAMAWGSIFGQGKDSHRPSSEAKKKKSPN